MNAIKDLFANEESLFALVLVIAATVLTGLHIMTIDGWQTFVTWVFGIYAAHQTVTTSVGLFKSSASAPTPAPAPALTAPALTASAPAAKS